MANPLRNVDSAYYGSKTPLEFRGTREGRKNPPPAPSYQHKGNDSTASSNKYYAAAQPPTVVNVKPTKKLMTLRMKTPETVVSDIITMFQDGATHIQVLGVSAEHVRNAQTSVDMAVGRNILTRAQADGITFIFDAIKEVTPEPVIAPEPDVTLTEEPAQTIKLADVEELMPPPPKAKASKKPKKKKEEPTSEQQESEAVEPSEEITEADIAAAFGVVEEGDD